MGNLARYRAYKLLSFIAYILPLAILFAFNYNSYIRTPAKGIGFFGYILIIFILIGFKSKIQSFAKKNTVLTVSLIVFIVAFIMQFLAKELLMISGMSLAGCVLSAVVEPVADVYYSLCYEHTTNDIRQRRRGVDTMPHGDAWRLAYGRG